ncbi:ATPase, E1-E2 type:Heavy metal-(Cd/Co/Hg/Pb/Zn)-translocating P-type ATPase:Heavy metal translocating P-type ATPase [Propionibacterium freudenreichii]|uniref:heavy metal translocating P-type ATPase n=1 Tax=Propionibacterium freudenreichii TaxID=1744 RepID=UPI000542CA16|nr:cation-translocating P-type ATPase [Propionibacterium freudenreichii]MDK9676385.1 cation-translocating P-type ATPase [Propionibacterium freudenreichii]CEG93706.1 ATPase, E1-E2 type:Heavy metal-(Cd/Co/Hg/Pb/Zn)-translocating P-type ATPase:Heavy metal translocating P-type ATPase [Propionibacterium freudenreichii]CEI46179.1 ATPase, E1-E2 type:Heavy metal-(Cd/Co/Hg/Pb/Zn)-translocating P-type ATPase:Heavy metal translocating P-type ATPase [Propionibacterium freudenreichii]SCQ45112.1 Metal cation
MSSATQCCDHDAPAGVDDHDELAWWRDREVMFPIGSGVLLAAGFVTALAQASTASLVLYWAGLLLGASTFVPGALRALLRGRLGISLLMMISAIGAVILGAVAEAAALAFLYSISEALEDKAMDRARSGLRALLELTPKTATVLVDGKPTDVEASQLQVGDLLLVRPGERVATDGVVRDGASSLDTSAITGESIPVQVGSRDAVSAGCINISGPLQVSATAPGSDNSLTTIVTLVEQAQAKKGRRARLADRIAAPLVPGVLILAVAVGVLGSLLGSPEVWIGRALVVLVAASPCALAIAVPVTVVSAIGAASRFGLVIKSGAAFEEFGAVRHVAFDKTGTLTQGSPCVGRVLTASTVDGGSMEDSVRTSDAASTTDPASTTSTASTADARPAGVSEQQVVDAAAALERGSNHPLATAIVAAATNAPGATDVTELPGRGIRGRVQGHEITVGSPRWLAPGALAAGVEQLETDGMTVVLVHRDGQPLGAIGIRDELRPEAAETIRALGEQRIGVTMLTGDNERTAQALARQAGIDDVRAGLRPEQKASAVSELSRRTPTAMIGDGINDAPALSAASLGIAMGARGGQGSAGGSDVAIESADVAFTGSDLRLLPGAFAFTRRGRRIMNQNIALSLLIIATLLPLAITGVLGLATVVLIHEGAEVIVIANGIRAARVARARGGAPAAQGPVPPSVEGPAAPRMVAHSA